MKQEIDPIVLKKLLQNLDSRLKDHHKLLNLFDKRFSFVEAQRNQK